MSKRVKIPLMIFVAIFTMSCSAPVSSVKNTYLVNIYEDRDDCISYRLPDLPDLDLANNDLEVVDLLIDHIREIRSDISRLQSNKCMK